MILIIYLINQLMSFIAQKQKKLNFVKPKMLQIVFFVI